MGAMEADLHAIERDLQAIRDRSTSTPGDRPMITATDTIALPPTTAPAPATATATVPTSDATADGNETMELDVRGLLDEKPNPLVGSSTPPTSSQSISDAAQAAASEMIAAPAPESVATETAKAPATIDLFGAEQAAVQSAALDDDSFFASLRDAVRDDAPLGPRDAAERTFFDQDDSKDSPSFREAFKRRR
jgi:hypothetical protein